MKFGIFLVLTLSLVGCRPDQEDSNFNELNGVEIIQGDIDQEVDSQHEEQDDLDDQEEDKKGDLVCADIDLLDKCIEQPACQPVYEEGITIDYGFVGCTVFADEKPDVLPLPVPMPGIAPELVGDNPKEDEEVQVVLPPPSYEDILCHQIALDQKNPVKKIQVCHVPGNNIEKAHTICISIKGWENGHQKRHQGEAEESFDYLGPCRESDTEVIQN